MSVIEPHNLMPGVPNIHFILDDELENLTAILSKLDPQIVDDTFIDIEHNQDISLVWHPAAPLPPFPAHNDRSDGYLFALHASVASRIARMRDNP
jgi:hypothetical protein